jgi:UDP-N-acetylglucosamine 2-epimerase
MYDATLQFAESARHRSTILQAHNLLPGKYLLATLHRPYNTDDPEKLAAILKAFRECGETVIFPVHPRTRSRIAEFNLLNSASETGKLKLIEPVSYLDMLILENHARLILTDSGGIQKEAYFFGVPCLTLRPETEWVETIEAGWNLLVKTTPDCILAGLQHHFPLGRQRPEIFGDGHSAERIVAAFA